LYTCFLDDAADLDLLAPGGDAVDDGRDENADKVRVLLLLVASRGVQRGVTTQRVGLWAGVDTITVPSYGEPTRDARLSQSQTTVSPTSFGKPYEKSMNLQEWASVATIIGSAALVISAWLLFHELRISNKLVRAANTQSLVELSSPHHVSLLQDRQLAELFVHGSQQYKDMDEVDRYRYKALLTWWLIFYENIYYQWQQGLLDDNNYKPWAAGLRLFIRRHQLQAHWDEMGRLFQDDFAQYVREQAAEIEEDPDPSWLSL
jgi:hypothetical protein